MLFPTKGIVLRSVKYGDTSLIVNIFTEQFGLQSYIINGVRSSSKTAQGKSGLYQPGSLLELIVYHNDLKNLQRIKEARWSCLYQTIFFDVRKNSVSLFIVELLHKCLKQPEAFATLYAFIEDVFFELDQATDKVTANMPLFVLVHLSSFLGHSLTDNYQAQVPFLDLKEGIFCREAPSHPQYLEAGLSEKIAELIRTQHPKELESLILNRTQRNVLIDAMLDFYRLHLPEFGSLKSLEILKSVME